MQYGLADAAYYSAPEGERAIRDAVFGQVLGELQSCTAIHEIQVNSGVEPLDAHLGYWGSRQMIDRALDLLRANTQ